MTPPTLADARRRLQEWATDYNSYHTCYDCHREEFTDGHEDGCPRGAAQQVLAHLDALEADALAVGNLVRVIGSRGSKDLITLQHTDSYIALTARLDAK